jgi:drug/metabolite transporter (DMT)-like permease
MNASQTSGRITQQKRHYWFTKDSRRRVTAILLRVRQVAIAIMTEHPTRCITFVWAICYVLSGIIQPLLMTVAKEAGLADARAQLYMFFYYAGPSTLLCTLCTSKSPPWPSRNLLAKAAIVALVDICAQGLNYTGASLAGPTVFAIIYSSVTVWTAVFSKLFLGRSLTQWQWAAVFVVVCGLSLTATDSRQLGPDVARGTLLVLVGSLLHGSTYVMSEAIMTASAEQLTPRQNAAIQGSIACAGLGLWQIAVTLPQFDLRIREPMQQAGTTVSAALCILVAFGIANTVHSVTFSHTLKYFPGGATSAGVMKGLQAVLVFVAAHFVYCGRVGGAEMCFTTTKFLSLVTVTGGVVAFGVLNERNSQGYTAIERSESTECKVVEPFV